MKTKPVNKGEKKRSLSETSIKTGPTPEEMLKSKKAKKMKNVNITKNGNSMPESTVHDLKRLNKKNKNKKAKQGHSLTTAEHDEQTLSKTKKKKLEYLQQRQLQRKIQKEKRKEMGTYNLATITLNVEQIKKRIAEIKSRETLSKTAKRKLGILNRKLRLQESENKTTIKNKSNSQDNQTDSIKDKTNKSKMEKKKLVKNKKVEIESEEDDQNDSHVEDTNDEDDSDEDQSNMEEEELEEEEAEKEEAEEEEDEEEEEEDDDSDENKEDEKDTDEEEIIVESKKKMKKGTTQVNQFSSGEKKEAKKQYVVFVGNLPLELTENMLKQHFLSKVDRVISVKIPTKPGMSNVSRGFGYVEVANKVDYEKALSLHNSLIKKRKINVEAVRKAPAGSQEKRKPLKKMK